ncbi:hypothetical protein RND81_08G010100 [Saponaria officinalis]|uniref:Uncharacterized protein n=1 Tax=Saponaria officinalis TaxID=3572 RepID=A0AAW1J2F7_SAPOF
MASSRVARIAIENAPPKFLKIMKRRTMSMLDTIHEDQEKECSSNSMPINLKNGVSLVDQASLPSSSSFSTYSKFFGRRDQ